MIDTHSPSGSWADILPYCTLIDIRDHDGLAEQLARRLAQRKAARLAEPSPHKRGHITRGFNRSAA